MSLGKPESTILNYLKARTLIGLRRLMLRNNAKHGVYFPYFDIQKEGGFWYAFYFQDIDRVLENDFSNESDD